MESSKAAQYSSALDAASLLQRHGFASLRIEGAGDVTLAVEMPPDSYGRLEATATLIVDVFVDGATAHQFWRPPNCVATTVESGKNCSAYANASFVETAAAYAWQGAANRARSKLLRVACGSLSTVAIDGGAPHTLSSLNAAQLYLERPTVLTDIHVASCAAPDYAYRYPAWPATLSADLERRQLDRLWRGMSRGVYLSDGGEAFSTWRERRRECKKLGATTTTLVQVLPVVACLASCSFSASPSTQPCATISRRRTPSSRPSVLHDASAERFYRPGSDRGGLACKS